MIEMSIKTFPYVVAALVLIGAAAGYWFARVTEKDRSLQQEK